MWLLLLVLLTTAANAQEVYEKVDDSSFRVTKTVVEEGNIEDVKKQINDINKIKEEYYSEIDRLDKKATDLELSIVEAKKVGVKDNVTVEEIVK